MMVWKAPKEVIELVEEVRDKYHSELKEAKIAVLMTDQKRISGNVRVLAFIQKASKTDMALHGYDYKLVICADSWGDLSDKEKLALIDHELCHAGVERVPVYEGRQKKRDEHGRIIYSDKIKMDEATGRPKFKLLPHDVETFLDVIDRHGLENCPEVTEVRRMRQVVDKDQ